MTYWYYYFRRQSLLFDILLGSSVLAVLLIIVPLDILTGVGAWISPYPYSGLQEKTIRLFEALKTYLPCLGIAGIAWIVFPGSARRGLRTIVSNVVCATCSLPVILLLAFSIRLAWVVFYPTSQYADSQWYFGKASELAQGLGYVSDTFSHKPTAVWPVGYPAFLALLFWITGSSAMVAKIANVILSVLIVALTFAIAKRLFDRFVAALSALLIAVLPGFMVYSSLLNSDILFIALFMCVLWLSLIDEKESRSSSLKSVLLALLAGLLNGAMILTHSTGLGLMPMWILIRWLAIGRQSISPTFLWRWTLIMGTGTFLVVMPWTIRNYLDFHRLIPVSTNGGMNFWIGNNPLAYGGFIFPDDPAHNPLIPLMGDEIAVDEAAYQAGLQFIQANPAKALRLLPAKLFYLYNSNDFGLEWNHASSSGNQIGTGVRAHVIANLMYVLLLASAMIGISSLLLERSSRQCLVWIGVILIAYWTLLYLPFFGQDRFALPVLPFITMYAAFGFRTVLDYAAQAPRSGT